MAILRGMRRMSEIQDISAISVSQLPANPLLGEIGALLPQLLTKIEQYKGKEMGQCSARAKFGVETENGHRQSAAFTVTRV